MEETIKPTTPNEVTTLKIPRSLWLRGAQTQDTNSMLLNPVVMRMCCLGILGEALGIPREVLANCDYPKDVDGEWLHYYPDWLLYRHPSGEVANSAPGSVLAKVNDDPCISEEDREMEVTAMFLEQGIKVVFVD